MPRYSYRDKNSNEIIKSVYTNSILEAVKYFAQIKVLDKEKFLNIYEVFKN